MGFQILSEDINRRQHDLETAKDQKTQDLAKEAINRDIARGNEIAKNNSTNTQVQTAFTSLLTQAGEYDKAIDQSKYAIASAQTSGNPKAISEALTTRSLAEYAKGDHAAADQDALAALKQDPTNKAAFSVHMLAGNRVPPTAGRIAEELAQQNPLVAHSPEDWTSRQKSNPSQAYQAVVNAMSSRKKGDLNAALAFANQAIAAAPSDPMGYVQRAIVYMQMGRGNEAFLDADRAIKMGWASDTTYMLRAKTLFNNKNFREAVYDAEMAVRLNPKAATAYHTRARAGFELHKQIGDLPQFADAFLDDLKTASSLDPRYKQEYEDMRAVVAELHTAQAQPKPQPLPAPPHSRQTTGWLILAGTALLLLLLVLILRRGKAEPTSPKPISGDTPALIGGSYKIVRRIGEGGMGVVYEAIDLKLKRRVALKKICQTLRADPGERRRFRDEAAIVANFKHPNIMDVYALVEEDGQSYMVCELLEGETLDDLIARRGPLAPKECLSVLRGVCSALGYAHDKGVIHRDLKPANIMIAQGAVKIMDFGLAHRTQNPDGHTQTDCVMGTPAYMAPEQGFGSVSRESDLYAVGVSLYQMVSGRLPFSGPTAQQDKLEGRFPPAGVPGLDDFFQQALQPDREKRFRNAKDFSTAFESRIA